MTDDTTRSEYIHAEGGVSANLNLRQDERVSLVLAVDAALRGYGVERVGAEFKVGEYAPNGHIGRLVDLARRLDDMSTGRQVWNHRREAPR